MGFFVRVEGRKQGQHSHWVLVCCPSYRNSALGRRDCSTCPTPFAMHDVVHCSILQQMQHDIQSAAFKYQPFWERQVVQTSAPAAGPPMAPDGPSQATAAATNHTSSTYGAFQTPAAPDERRQLTTPTVVRGAVHHAYP